MRAGAEGDWFIDTHLALLLFLSLFCRLQHGSPAEYRFYTEFQSHEAEFDYLKSLEIEEKINQIEWLKRSNVRSWGIRQPVGQQVNASPLGWPLPRRLTSC